MTKDVFSHFQMSSGEQSYPQLRITGLCYPASLNQTEVTSAVPHKTEKPYI